MSSSFISRASGLLQNDLFFNPNFLVSVYEINLRHFLPNQKVISQMNHTATNNLIRTTNSQSFSYFQNLKVCRTMFDFCVHALLNYKRTTIPSDTRSNAKVDVCLLLVVLRGCQSTK